MPKFIEPIINAADVIISTTDGCPKAQRVPSLPPLGVGTSQVESLVGYVTRLAMAMVYSPLDLMCRYLGWFVSDQPSFLGERSPAADTLTCGGATLTATHGPKIAVVIEKLNGIEGLVNLTATNLASIFSPLKLVRRKRAWCSCCLRDDKIPHDRLLWNLEGVTHCSEHGIALETECPECKASQPHLSHDGAAHRCFQCGANFQKTQPRSAEDLASYGVWAARTAAEFIGRIQCAPQGFSPDSLRRGIELGMKTGRTESTRSLAKALGVSHNTVRDWLVVYRGVRLDMALRVAWLYGVELSDLAGGGIDPSTVTRPTQWTKRLSRQRPPGTVSMEEFYWTVKRMTAAAPLKRLTQRDIATEMNISLGGTLFDQPDVADFLRKRQKRTLRIKSTLAVWETCNAMRNAARILLAAGRPITQRLVRGRLRHRGLKEGVMRSRHAQKFFFLMLRKIQSGDTTILCERAPPKIILPVMALSN